MQVPEELTPEALNAAAARLNEGVEPLPWKIAKTTVWPGETMAQYATVIVIARSVVSGNEKKWLYERKPITRIASMASRRVWKLNQWMVSKGFYSNEAGQEDVPVAPKASTDLDALYG